MFSSYHKKIGNYFLVKQIGTGSFAKVFKGMEEKTKEIVAIKMIQKSQSNEKNEIIEKELNILKSLSHPNIIKLKDSKKTQNNIYLIFEYCHLGDLESYIKKFYLDPIQKKALLPENIAQKIISQLSQAFRLMREKQIVHRDLKLANILLTNDFVIKLADFGFAKFAENNILLQSYCGTPITMAPEILKRKQYNEKCDIWSLGIIIYKMLYGEYPFFPQTYSLDDLIETILKGDLKFPNEVNISEQAKSLIISMLKINPEERLGFDEFFENEWVKGLPFQNPLNDIDLKEALKSVYQEPHKQKIPEKISVEKNQGMEIESCSNPLNVKILSSMKAQLTTLIISKINKLISFSSEITKLTERLLEKPEKHEKILCCSLFQFCLNRIKKFLSIPFEFRLPHRILKIEILNLYPGLYLSLKEEFIDQYKKYKNLAIDCKILELREIGSDNFPYIALIDYLHKLIANESFPQRIDINSHYPLFVQLCDILTQEEISNYYELRISEEHECLIDKIFDLDNFKVMELTKSEGNLMEIQERQIPQNLKRKKLNEYLEQLTSMCSQATEMKN